MLVAEDKKVLVVEDDPEVREVICTYLRRHGFDPVTESDGRKALKKLSDIELLVLDLQIPGMDGLEVVRLARQRSHVPILIVSARGEGPDRVIGLELGADDYLTKPFLPQELVARVKALMRRAELPSTRRPRGTGLSLDAEARAIFIGQEELPLTPREYALLKTIVAARGKTFTRSELLDRVWGEEYTGDDRRVDLVVSKVRNKLAERGLRNAIRSVWGVGYRYD
ncbi:MAG: response regulator transcription factor [Candidatus Eremiobacteraeota bacterium]|nr:response regulator transcription factor [Candidatus Eremiobacteraeota bacterium]